MLDDFYGGNEDLSPRNLSLFDEELSENSEELLLNDDWHRLNFGYIRICSVH